MKNNKILVTFLIIFVIISLLLGSYIIYKEYFKDSKCDNIKIVKNEKTGNVEKIEEMEVKKEKMEEEIKKAESNNYVIDLVNIKKEPKYVGTCNLDPRKGNIDIKLPKINIDTANAKKLNNLIQTDYKKEYEISSKDETDIAFIDSSYKYVVRNNIIFLYVESTLNKGCGTGSTTHKNYYFDIKNDKILTTEEGFKKAGYSLDDLRTEAYKSWNYQYTCENGEVKTVEESISPWDITFDMCDKNACGCGLKIINENLLIYYVKECA